MTEPPKALVVAVVAAAAVAMSMAVWGLLNGAL